MSFVIPPSFVERLSKSKKEKEEREILETFCKMEVNILLLDYIKEVSRYARFLKELCTNRRKIAEHERVL